MDYAILRSPLQDSWVSSWNECLDASEFATYRTAPEFFDDPYFAQKQPFAIVAVERGTVHGVVTGAIEGRDIRCGSSGSPQVCIRRSSDRRLVGRTLAAGLRAHASSSVEVIGVYSWSPLAGFESGGFKSRSFEAPLGTILLELAKGRDLLFKQCSETRRNKLRRALKAGVLVEPMDLGRDFDEYYELYRHWCAFKRLPCVPYELQRAVFALRSNRLVLVARFEQRLIGVSTFLFRAPGMVEYAANVSRRDETRVRQNDLLLWRGIEWAVEQGRFNYFSMAGAHFFLQKFGGTLHTTYRLSLDQTMWRRRDLREGLLTVTTKAYRRLPQRVRTAAKRLLGKSDGET